MSGDAPPQSGKPLARAVLLRATRRVARLLRRHLQVATRALTACTLGMVTSRGRAEVRRIADALGMIEGTKPTLPIVGIDELTADGEPLRLYAIEPRNGNVSIFELVALSRLVRARRPRTIFEIGTFDGRTTLNLVANAPEDARAFTLDLPRNAPTAYLLEAADAAYVDKPSSGERLRGTPWAARVTQLYGDSATFDFSPYDADFVFVDGSHAYEYVLNDSARALALTAGRPATIVWHDFGAWDGVTRALNELASRDPRFASVRHVRGTTLAVLTT